MFPLSCAHPLIQATGIWARGALGIDDTVLPKPGVTVLAGLAWVVSNQARKPADGLSVVVVWTKRTLRMPLDLWQWHPGALPSTLALE